jgi:hypothetical protein
MNPFKGMLTDKISIVKPDGNVLGPFKASVQRRQILFFEVQDLVSAGDKVLRELPNGVKETYLVENPEHHGGLSPHISPFYRLHVRKEDDLAQSKTLFATNILNFKGEFPRVNFQSADNSVNVQDRSKPVFDATREKLHAAIEDQDVLKELLTHLQVMEDAKSRSTWATAYSKFIERVANHMAIIAPLLPALADTVNYLKI